MSQKRVFVPQKIITKINLWQVTVHFVLKHAEVRDITCYTAFWVFGFYLFLPSPTKLLQREVHSCFPFTYQPTVCLLPATATSLTPPYLKLVECLLIKVTHSLPIAKSNVGTNQFLSHFCIFMLFTPIPSKAHSSLASSYNLSCMRSALTFCAIILQSSPGTILDHSSFPLFVTLVFHPYLKKKKKSYS